MREEEPWSDHLILETECDIMHTTVFVMRDRKRSALKYLKRIAWDLAWIKAHYFGDADTSELPVIPVIEG